MSTPLYPTFRKRVDDAIEKLIRQQVTPWSFMAAGPPFRIKYFDGREIAYQGVTFDGSPREVFWSRYIEPYLEELCISEITAAVSMARERQVDAKLLLPELQELLSAGFLKVYRKMADVDQRLRGKGYPEKVSPRGIDDKLRVMEQFLDERIRAEIVMLKPKSRFQAGARFGNWELIEYVGNGGSGTVWKAKDRDGRLGAIKFLHRKHLSDKTRCQRFKDEVESMRACGDIPGVLPLLDFNVRESYVSGNDAWLVSAYAVPLDKAAGDVKNLEAVVRLCMSLGETLSLMHERGYSHRDIKPENIFQYNGRWWIGDFGIVDFPEKGALTQKGEKLGPLYYMAPEMLNDAEHADGRCADVYSLGKLLWKMATGQKYPIPGVQSADEPALTISAYVAETNAYLLDHLLEATTQFDPKKRPLMKDFSKELSLWLEPPSKPKGPTDLAPFAKRVRTLTQSFDQDNKRRVDIQAKAISERTRVFNAFNSTLSEIGNALEMAGIMNVEISPPSGGNHHFYYAKTRDNTIGRDDGIWFFQYALNAKLQDGQRRLTLMAGVDLGIKNVDYQKAQLLDIYAPVLAAAGYIIKLDVLNGQNWNESSHLVWGETDSFFFGQPSELTVINRFAAGLLDNLSNAVEQLIEKFEIAGEKFWKN